MKKISFDESKLILDKFVLGKRACDIAKEFKISKHLVSSILHGSYYKSLKRPENIDELIRLSQGRRNCKTYNFSDLTENQLNLIIGSLLGDGWITKPGKYSESKFGKRQKYPDHVNHLFENLNPYSLNVYESKSTREVYKDNKVLKSREVEKRIVGYQFHTVNHKIFTELRSLWYPNGIKSVPKNLKLNSEILSVWYIDDGSNSPKSKKCELYTNGFVFEDVEFLKYRLEMDLGLFSKLHQVYAQSGKRQFSLYFIGENYFKFIKEVTNNVFKFENYRYKVLSN